MTRTSIRSSLPKQCSDHHRVQIESLSILSSPVILLPSHSQSRTRMSGVLPEPGNPPSCSVPASWSPLSRDDRCLPCPTPELVGGEHASRTSEYQYSGWERARIDADV